jgi:hypothetical protein
MATKARIAHTPGPWRLDEIQPGDKDIRVRGDTLYYTDAVICQVNYDDVDHDEMRGYAALIAAAPDLLSAARFVLACCEHCGSERYADCPTSRGHGRLLTAIAKAGPQ